ncbi:hypothetical protein CBER1_01574 [Cercospora berteroae]|uniref:ATP-dependent RNA helicase DBP8 n=1 Tax=Cercospora berteroae TaxID=357750 RepID=A0A2S6C7P6_9PEZI|nr:hypothetical protein CBER1_01574 [Cercospora berteroae]
MDDFDATDRPSKRRRLSDGESQEIPPAVGIQDGLSRIKKKSTADPRPDATPDQKNESTGSTLRSIHDSMDDNEPLTFTDLGVSPWLIQSLKNLSISHPTRIQKSTIPQILAGRDCIGGSRTGSGKTIAFSLPILQQWSKEPSGIFALILTPTRELALQIYEQIQAIGGNQGIRSVLVTGGAEMRKQAIELEKRPHVVIATPGRLADHVLNSGEDTIKGFRKVKFVVFDEADRLLQSGKGSMLGDVERCLDAVPSAAKRQTLLFTATVTPEVRALKESPRENGRLPPFISEVDIDSLAIPPTLHQTYQLVNVLHKEKYLHVLLGTPANVEKTTIIFANRAETANLLEYMLRGLEHRVTALHSGLAHEDRVNNLARFRAKAARILVATDVASRGLDIPDVGLVINYDLPRNPDDYIHRVGRTARAGRRGVSISLVGQRDVELVKAIEERVGKKMAQYEEDKVSVETRVIKEALNVVGDMKREAMLAIEEGRDVKGKRKHGAVNALRASKKKKAA